LSSDIANSSEANGSPAIFRFSRTGSTTAPLSVSYRLLGTAQAGSDYSGATTGTISFSAGSATAELSLAALADSVVDPGETIIAQILPSTTATPSYLITPGQQTATATITAEGMVVKVNGPSRPGWSKGEVRNGYAFAALKSNGTVVSWGDASYGGTTPAGLGGVTQIFSNTWAFAALKSNGSVVSWGYPMLGGYTTPAGLGGVTQIFTNSWASAALKSDGTVVSWGDPDSGGTTPAGLSGVTQIFYTDNAFAALKSDGTVVSWGDPDSGGTTPAGLGGVVGFANPYTDDRLLLPTTAAATAISDNVGIIQGTVASGATTDDSSLSISGTLSAALEAGETVRIYDGTEFLGTAIVSADGSSWSYDDSRTLANTQSVSYTAWVANAAGESDAGTAYTATVDPTAPTTTAAVTAITDDFGIFQGTVPSGFVTDDSSLSIGGTISAALADGETVRIYDGVTFLGNAAVSGTTWSYDDSRMLRNNQIVSYTARVADAAGNLRLAYSSLANSNRSYYMLSSAGTWTEAQAEAVSMGGNLATINDEAENQFLVTTFGGTEGLWIGLTDEAEEGRFKWVNGELAAYRNWHPGEPNGGGGISNNQDYAWINFQEPGKWDDDYSYVTQREIIELPGYIITVDTTAPTTTAAVTAITDDFGIFQGTVPPGDVTDDSSLSIGGTISAVLKTDETVRIYDGTEFLGTASVSADRTTWSYADSRTLSNNQIVSYTARVADAAGKQSAAGSAYTANIDTSAPAAPTLALANDTGSSNSDGITKDGRINVTGLEAGASWEYSTDSGDSWLPGTDGSFDLLIGTYTASDIRVRQVDRAGNTSFQASLLPGLATDSIKFLTSTGHYYEFLSGEFTWAEARDRAASKTFYGATGYLATIKSGEENDFLARLITSSITVWLGASDAYREGVWKWVTGPEAGTVFWNGGPDGSTPPEQYAN
jgi:hypothetical protein